MNVKAKRITTIAMLCALAYVVMAVGRVPVVLFLKYDPKDVVITLGGLIWGPMTACLVSVLVSVLEMFTVSDTGILGCIMNILSTCACTGDRRRRNPASTPRRSFWAVAASAGWRISRPAAARPPLSFSSFTVGKRPAGRRWSCASAKGSAAVSPLTTFPCCRHSSGWIASPPSPFEGFPPAPPGCPWSPQDDGRW